MNLNTLILTAADYKVILRVPTAKGILTFTLLTPNMLKYTDAVEGEYSYAIGSTEPIGNKTNSASYKGSLSIQVGELLSILALCGFSSGIQIKDATLAIAALVGGFNKVYTNLNILSDGGDVAAKAKETFAALEWQAIGLG